MTPKAEAADPILCQRCGDPCLLRWQTHSNATRHVRADCPRCGQFARFVPQTPGAVAEADANGEWSARRAQTAGLFDGADPDPTTGAGP
jgi:hypothetical protein